MGDKLPQRAPFIDVIGLSNPTEERRRALAYTPDYVTAFQVWRCFPEESFGLLGSLNLGADVFSQNLGFDRRNFVERDKFTKTITPDEAEHVYDVVVGAVHEFSRDPERDMYRLLRKAYVQVLKIGVEKSNFTAFVRTHIEPYFGSEHYLDSHAVNAAIVRLPDDEQSKLSPRQLNNLRKGGITRQEISDTFTTVQKADRARKTLHETLQSYGQKLGLSQNDVNAQIFFEYSGFMDRSNMQLDTEKRQVRILGGVLMFPGRDPDTRRLLPEFKLGRYDPNSEDSRDWYLKAQAQSEAVLTRYKGGEDMGEWYKSSMMYDDDIENDGTMLDQIKAQFPDLPMSTVLEIYLCMHNTICASHRLDIDISGIYDDPAMLEQRLSELKKAMEELGIQK